MNLNMIININNRNKRIIGDDSIYENTSVLLFAI